MVTNQQAPVTWSECLRAEFRCILRTFWLLAHWCIRQPSGHFGRCLRFADGTSAPVYRETIVKRGPTRNPCVLIVEFRLRGMHGWLHVIFRWESLLNTPLFVGYPGFVSKLWLANDQHNVYRGVYEWDGPELAEYYARCLWPVLTLGSVTGSVHYRVLSGLRRDGVLANPGVLDGYAAEDTDRWWRIVEVT